MSFSIEQCSLGPPDATTSDNARTRFWAQSVKLGDHLVPIDLWNNSERLHRLPIPCRVRGWKTSISQTGISFYVKTVSGQMRWLDAAWFKDPHG